MFFEVALRVKLVWVVMLSSLLLTATAGAERRILLIGVRHAYDIGAWPDPNASVRKQIEETYARAVVAAQDRYDQSMTSIAGAELVDKGAVHQGDRDSVQYQAESDIEHAAEARDADLAKLYPLDDGVLQQYPNLAIDADGPYQVLALELVPSPEVHDVEFLEPYPDFGGVAPFGWSWGSPHTWFQYTVVVESWHKRWHAHGRPAFVGLYLGRRLVDVHLALRVEVISGQTLWVAGAPPAFDGTSRAKFVAGRSQQTQAGLLREPSYVGAAREIAARQPVVSAHVPTAEEALRTRRARIAAAHVAAARAAARREATRRARSSSGESNRVGSRSGDRARTSTPRNPRRRKRG